MKLNTSVLKENIVIISKQQEDALNNEFFKAIDEIKENTADNKRWFYYKLILIGSLVGAIIFQVIKKLDDDIEYISIIKKRAFPITIGIAFVIAIIIDIQVKQNLIVTNQLGNWIAFQYEPVMKYSRTPDSNGEYASSKKKDTIFLENNSLLDFYLWENFLRVEKDYDAELKEMPYDTCILSAIKAEIEGREKGKEKFITIQENLVSRKDSYDLTKLEINYYLRDHYKLSESQHTDILYSVFHFPAFHMLSWILYAVFLCSFYFTIGRIKTYETDQRIMLVFILIAVHLSITIFALLSRAQTGLFAMQYSLFSPDKYATPIQSGLFNALLSFLLLISNLVLYLIINRKLPRNEKHLYNSIYPPNKLY